MDNMDEDFMNELQELTKNMTKEFSGSGSGSGTVDKSNQTQTQSVKETANNTNTEKNKEHFNMFNMNNDEDCVKELEKLLSLGMDMNIDENDPQTKKMMKLLNENLKDLEVKMGEMQKNLVVNENPQFNNNIQSAQNIASTQSNPFTIPNPDSTAKKPSNPFVDTFREMKDNPLEGGLMDILKLFEQGGSPDQNMGDIKNLYDILGKLSDNKDTEADKVNPSEGPEKSKQLESLFGDLLEFLLKSDMLGEPLTQIKSSVNSYLEKNKDKLKPEDEEKYKSMLSYIDTIMEEIHKKEPNKALVIEVFYKLHELSDIDGEILSGDNAFKQFSDLFAGAQNSK